MKKIKSTYTLKVNCDFSCKLPNEFKLKLNRLIKNFVKEIQFLIKKAKISNRNLEINLTICGNQKIRSLNKKYRNKDKATDVLSFPLFLNLDEVRDTNFSEIILGDIFISHPVAKKQAKEFNLSVEKEIIYLLVHGFLHLIGYDHERSIKDEKEMFDLELKIVKKILK